MRSPSRTVREPVTAPKPAVAEIVFMGFRQTESVRKYLFQVTDGRRERHEYLVDVDLNLMRTYRLSIQEMPLLCRRLLETRPLQDETGGPVVFTESDMVLLADMRKAENEALNLRRARRPANRHRGTDMVLGRANHAI